MNINNHALFWIMLDDSPKLATKNLVKGNRFYSEKLVDLNGEEYRIWKPYRSKLASAIINGIEIFPILKKSKILYFGATTGITVSHISDIVGANGKVFVVKDINHRSNFLEKVKRKRANIKVIDGVENLGQNNSIIGKVDVLYVNLLTQNHINIIMNLKPYLKDDGYVMLVIKTKLFENKNYEELQNDLYKKISHMFKIIQVIDISDFHKEHSLIIAKSLD